MSAPDCGFKSSSCPCLWYLVSLAGATRPCVSVVAIAKVKQLNSICNNTNYTYSSNKLQFPSRLTFMSCISFFISFNLKHTINVSILIKKRIYWYTIIITSEDVYCIYIERESGGGEGKGKTSISEYFYIMLE